MSATALPLPLALTKPVTLASDPDTLLRESLGVGKYDPKMQISMWYDDETTSENVCNCGSVGNMDVDVVLDDIDIN